jgi:NADH:ubiquinone oxidoreductase subunit F (NADH-binding)
MTNTVTQEPRVLARAVVDSLAAYEQDGGGRGLASARELDAEAILATIQASGLRGRGGAGFPTGRKWRTVAAYGTGAVERPNVVVNAAEGEPGSFKDREILRRNPYPVLEGALIAALAVGADEIVVALKESFSTVRSAVVAALDEIRAAGWTEGVEVSVFAGPSEYLYGEETGLLEVLDGRDPFPRISPPYRRGMEEIVDEPSDLDSESTSAAHVELAGPSGDAVGPPTLVNNVETLANVPGVIARGAAWFRSLGTDESPGTVVCTVTGATQHAGVVEVPMGTPLRAVIDAGGGGPRPGHTITAVMGGVSSALLSASDLDVPVTHEAMNELGAGLGCGAFIVFDDATDFTAVAEGVARFLSVESCGQCVPCKRDGLALTDLFGRVRRSEADAGDRDEIDERLRTVGDSARCNLAAQYQQVLRSILDQFDDQVTAHLDGSRPAVDEWLVAPVESLDAGTATLDAEHRNKQPDWTFDVPWSGKSPADRLSEHRGGER